MCGPAAAERSTCTCNGTGAISSAPNNERPNLSPDSIINLDHGDPTAFESYWEKMGDRCTVKIDGSQSMSYFSDVNNFCWFLEPELGEAIKKLHRTVGNAVIDDHHLVVGTGSSQLFMAALYALCPSDAPEPVSVVSELPYYSCYPDVTNFLRSGLYKWAGDSRGFNREGPYIEMVTTPNNPDGFTREPVVVNRGGQGKVVYDLAYYWPQYTPITGALDHDIMLFTASKCTGHAGSRLGWALVKDKEVAMKMTHFMTLNTIGVSKEPQLRVARILQVINQSYQDFGPSNHIIDNDNNNKVENFFEHGQRLMAKRWSRLREVVARSDTFTLPNYPSEYCCFSGHFTQAHPAFAWVKCTKEGEDSAAIMRKLKILTRSGTRFGVDVTYARVSLVDRDDSFNLFLERLSTI